MLSTPKYFISNVQPTTCSNENEKKYINVPQKKVQLYPNKLPTVITFSFFILLRIIMTFLINAHEPTLEGRLSASPSLINGRFDEYIRLSRLR